MTRCVGVEHAAVKKKWSFLPAVLFSKNTSSRIILCVVQICERVCACIWQMRHSRYYSLCVVYLCVEVWLCVAVSKIYAKQTVNLIIEIVHVTNAPLSLLLIVVLVIEHHSRNHHISSKWRQWEIVPKKTPIPFCETLIKKGQFYPFCPFYAWWLVKAHKLTHTLGHTFTHIHKSIHACTHAHTRAHSQLNISEAENSLAQSALDTI